MHYLLIIVILLCISYCVVQLGRNKLRKRVFQFPACFFELPILGSLYRFAVSTDDVMKTIEQAGYNTIRLGGIGRLYGVNIYFLVITDVNDVEEVLKVYLNKDSIYEYFHEVTGNASAFILDSGMGKVRRHYLLPAFSSKMLESYIDPIWQGTIWLTDILSQYEGKGPICAGNYISAHCLNTFFSLSGLEELRKEVCTLKLCSDYSLAIELLMCKINTIWMHSNVLYRLSSTYRKVKKLSATFYHYASKGQEIRRNEMRTRALLLPTKDDTAKKNKSAVKSGLLDSLLKSNLSNKEISQEIVVLMGASEEVSAAIGVTLMLLGQYHEIQNKVYEELVNVFGDSNRTIKKDDLKKMPYLEMVIKETMRLYSPVPFIARKAHTDFVLSSGRKIPCGVGICIPIICINRNPKYWGTDADHFDPERFSPERLKGVPKNAYIPFSMGPRGCPGYKLGISIIKISLCAILRKFKVVDNPASSPIPNIKTKYELSTKSVTDVEIKLENRI